MGNNERVTGVVKWYFPNRGYGFITGNDGTVYFAYHTEIKKDGFRKLKKGEKVSFMPGEDTGKASITALDIRSEE